MATALSVSNFSGQPVNISTPDAYHLRPDGGSPTGESIWDHVIKFFGGSDNKQAYQNALTENNRAYEQALLKQARDYETWFDSTAVQRRVADIKAAGLNPWLALQSGNFGANGSGSASVQPGAGSSAKQVSKEKSGISSLAMLLLSTARLLAAI